jgi:hypothetical protein
MLFNSTAINDIKVAEGVSQEPFIAELIQFQMPPIYLPAVRLDSHGC